MVCKSSCILAGALLGGFGLTSLLAFQKSSKNDFREMLNSDQIVKYEEITTSRKRLATHGMLFGVLLSFVYVLYTRFSTQTPETQVETGKLICNVISITLGTTWAYYMLSPKLDHMVRYLGGDIALIDLYLEKNRTYQLRWTAGLLFGAAGAYFLGQGLYNK